MYQIASGKRISGVWHVWVRVGGQWYGSSAFSLDKAIFIAIDQHLGSGVSKTVN